ncbi:MAG: protein-disulfide reductase DsbD domain-containing protein [Rubrimonas sp.]
MARMALTVAAAALATVAAQAQDLAPGIRAQAMLSDGWAEPDGARVAGLSIALAEGWKTYWRAPGEAGIPPLFDWSGSRNVAAVEVVWPTPHVFDSFGIATIGYSDHVTLPLRVTLVDATAPASLALALDFGVCAEICVPERAELTLDLPAEAPGAPGGPIASALARAPLPGSEAGLARAECALIGAGAERRFEARLVFEQAPPRDALLVVEGPPGAWFAPPVLRVEGRALVAEGEARLWDPALWIGRDALRLSLVSPAGVIEQRGCAAPGAPSGG